MDLDFLSYDRYLFIFRHTMSTFHILDFNFIEVQKLLFLQSSDTYIYMTMYFLASPAPLWFLGQITRNVKHVGSPNTAQQCYIKYCVCKMLNHKCIFHKNTTPLFRNLPPVLGKNTFCCD